MSSAEPGDNGLSDTKGSGLSEDSAKLGTQDFKTVSSISTLSISQGKRIRNNMEYCSESKGKISSLYLGLNTGSHTCQKLYH